MMFKKLFCCLAVLMLIGGVCAAEKKTSKKPVNAVPKEQDSLEAIPGLPQREANWKGGPNRTWEINFNNAALKAKAEKKKLLVLKSGSDWCPPCKKLKSAVIGNSKFKKMAEKSFILVFIDFPRSIELPETQKMHNAMVSKKFNFGNGVPSALIINPATLKVEGQIMGYRPAKEYLKALQKFAPAVKKAKKK